ncbi:MAG: LytTR family DNA-binding domain-containing protein [Flavobacterium haoranii]
MNKKNVLIIDDEIESCKLIELYLNKYFKQIENIYYATTIEEGLVLFFEHKPSLLLLDVNLENENIFTFLDKIHEYDAYKIFITSYDEFALKAYDYAIKSYILKPVQIDKFIREVSIALDALSLECSSKHLLNNDLLAISSIDKYEILITKDIIYLEADGRYTTFYLKNNTTKVATTNLGEYEQVLDKTKFIRIHHKYIVNVNHLIKIEKNAGYDCLVTGDSRLPISKRKVNDVIHFLKLK